MITDTLKDLLLEQYIDRGFLKKEIRSYEVSLWTLQDDFMTVLKWSDAEQKGRIENPKMTLNTDGTLKLSFSIPMYYRVNGELVENPNWYNTLNGYLMTGLRKIKVIFNKDDITFGTLDTEENASSHVFEFVITNITESHENDILTCNIECEGLAFLELGKVGYKVNLSQDNFELIYKDWSTKGYWFDKNNRKYSYLQLKIVDDNPATNGIPGAGPGILYIHKTAGNLYEGYLYRDNNIEHVCSVRATKPILSLDYWCEEAGIERWTGTNVNPKTWYYDLEMDWKSFSDSGNRVYYKLYEEPYVSSWDDDLKPLSEESYLEKARAVKVEKSNLYNITLTIAETFEVFCRYKYYYDENYHIIGRRIIFYNNFIQDDTDKMLTLLYPYSSSKIERKMESESVTTKLFVLDTDNSSTMSGYSSIMNAPPNDSKEDYILNFDYMLRTNAITQQLYDEIQPYKQKMRQLNTELVKLLQILSTYLVDKPKIEAKKTVAKNSIKLDDELIDLNTALSNALDTKYGDADGLITRDGGNADLYIISQNSNTVKLLTNNKGIMPETIKAYTVFESTVNGPLLSNPVDVVPNFDEYNNLESLTISNPTQLVNMSKVAWKEIFNTYYLPAGYEGNVDLMNRNIINSNRLTNKGWTVSGTGLFYTLFNTPYKLDAQNHAITKWNEELNRNVVVSKDEENGKMYIFVMTPIKEDGTVLTELELRSYFNDILKGGNTKEQWLSVDKSQYKLIIGCLLVADYKVPDENNNSANNYTNNRANAASWANEVAAKQSEWLRIRASNNWFGYQPLLDGDVGVTTTDYTDLTYCTSANISAKTTVATADHLYLTYDYNPRLYYENIVKTWQAKRDDDDAEYKLRVRELGPTSIDDTDYDIEAVYEYYAADISSIPSTPTNRKKYANATEADKKLVLEEAYKAGLNKRINDTTADIESKIQEKNEAIKVFEHMMGPALREGYWQPENYNDYGDHHTYSSDSPFTIPMTGITNDAKDGLIIGWDTELFDDEDKLYYEIGVARKKEYYPCLDLNSVFPNGIPSDLEKYNLIWLSSNLIFGENDSDDTARFDSRKDLQMFAVGSQALIKYIKYNNSIKPVLVIVGAKSFSGDLLKHMINNGHIRLAIYYSGTSHYEPSTTYDLTSANWLCFRTSDFTIPGDWADTGLENIYNVVSDNDVLMAYARIKFSSMSLKTDTSNLVIHYNDELLDIGEDYRVNTRNTLRNSLYYPEYYVTIKPEVFIKNLGIDKAWTVDYVFSNANTAIYLDALKVSKENAVPKVSYTIDINLLDLNLMRELYSKLAQIVMVNDTDLKFENVFGYISGLDLDLDRPWLDTVEIKNYKTKFEDLFSSIVAQTEAMKQSSANLSTAISGDIPLSEEGLSEVLANEKTQNILNAYLDSHFDSSLVVRDRLTELFAEAGEILGGANKSLNSLSALTLENASILSSFARNIAEELTVKIHKSETRPAKFNKGDIWILTDSNGNEVGRYMAITSSEMLADAEKGSSTSGFVKTYDGSLASITGADVHWDANTGIVDITGQNYINIRGGNNIYIAANDTVDIVGNKAVNIGGTLINLCTLYKKVLNEEDSTWATSNELAEASGINLIAGAYDPDGNYGSTSRVLISPNKVEIGAGELELKAASKINLITSLGLASNTSAVHISAEDGIWLGTGATNGVRIFGGAVTLNDDGTVNTTNSPASGASVEINSEHLILGFSGIGNVTSSVMEMFDEGIILAAGGVMQGRALTHLPNAKNIEITGTSSGLTGTKITKDSIGFATVSVNNNVYTYNALIMNNKGITIGSTHGGIDLANSTSDELKTHFESTSADGSYVRIAGEGIELGSLSDLYINTDNFKLQTHSRDKANNTGFTDGHTIMAVGNALLKIDDDSAYNPDTDRVENKLNNTYTAYTDDSGNIISPLVDLLLNSNGLYIRGNVYATAFIAQASNGYFKATGTNLGFYGNNGSAKLTIDSNGYILAADLLHISADNLYIGSSNYSTLSANITNNNIIESLKMYRLWNSNSSSTNMITGSGTTTADPNWDEYIPTPTTSTPYIWSVMRYKKGDDKYYYSDPKYESTLSNLEETTYYKFKRTNSTTEPIINNLNDLNTNWFLEVPTDTASGGSSSAALFNNPYIWRTIVTVKVGDRITWSTPERAEDYEGFSNAGLSAINIANGYTSVPHVETTGISIANGSMSITAEASLTILGNHSITIGSDISNSAVIINNNGISIGTGKSIGIAAGGVLDINTTNLILKSNATGANSIFELKKQASDWTAQNNHYDTAMKYSITNGLEVTGAILATSGIIGNNTTSYPYYDEIDNLNLTHRYYAWTSDDDNWYHGWHIADGILKSEDLFRDNYNGQTSVPDEQGHNTNTIIYSLARIYSNPRLTGDDDPNAWSMGTYTCRTFDRTTVQDTPPYYYPDNNDTSGTPCKYTISKIKNDDGEDIGEDIMNYSFFTHGGCLVSNHASLRRLYYDIPTIGEKEIDLGILCEVIDNWDIIKVQIGLSEPPSESPEALSGSTNISYTYTEGTTGIMGGWSGTKSVSTTAKLINSNPNPPYSLICKLTWGKTTTTLNNSTLEYVVRYKDTSDIWRQATVDKSLVTIADIQDESNHIIGRTITIPFISTITSSNLDTIGIKVVGHFTLGGSQIDDDTLHLKVTSIITR